MTNGEIFKSIFNEDPLDVWVKVATDFIKWRDTERKVALKEHMVPCGTWVEEEKGIFRCSVCKAVLEEEDLNSHWYRCCYHCGTLMNMKRLGDTDASGT